jgi:hypothetical protein
MFEKFNEEGVIYLETWILLFKQNNLNEETIEQYRDIINVKRAP